MEIDLELPSCEQEKLDIRLGKDVSIEDASDEINVEKTSEHVKEAHGLSAHFRISGIQDQGGGNGVILNVVDNGAEKISEQVKEAHGLSANESISEVQDRSNGNGIVLNVVDEGLEKNSEHVKEAHGLSANESVFVVPDRDVGNDIVSKVVDKGVVREPENGMEFDSKEDVYSFYREYAQSVGFGITIKASRRSKKSGKFIDIKLACCRFRKNDSGGTTVNPSFPLLSTDCKAGLQMKKRENEKWFIYSFVKEHNHEIFPDDWNKSVGRRNQRPVIDACEKKGLQWTLDEEDVRVMLEHFTSMQDENPNFFYAIDFDHDKRLRNIFWVDGKGRCDYSSFCDVVFFDTYYVRSNYKIPYIPIVGVNHHCQYIFLGCALIREETTETFVWLMRTWLKAVGSQAPRLVITDHGKYLKEAVADVFSDAYHRFCLWHVLTRIHENVGCSVNENEIFSAKLNKCIYRSWTVEQFEQRWWKLINRFELRENEQVRSLYEDREKWAPAFMQDSFLAGMSTSDRSGSITSFFDRYISQEATVKDFMAQHKAFLKDRYDMEADAAFETQLKQPELISPSPFEKQMSTIYTNAMFTKFQVEILGVASCRLQKEGEEEATVIFRVEDLEEQKNFVVAWKEPELQVCCLCHSFEYKGFLCRHAILVLKMSGVPRIPSHYILKRWTKDAKVQNTPTDMSKRLDYRVQRFNDLCKLTNRLGEEGSLSPETYNIAFQALEEVLKQCVNVNRSVVGVAEPNVSSIHGSNGVEEENQRGAMAKSCKKKNKKRKGQTEIEGIPIRLKDSFQQMELMNSRANHLDNCYLPQHELRTELDSRDCYGAQQSMQEMGRLTSVPSLRDGHYGSQQTSQFQGQIGFRAPTLHSCFDSPNNLQDMEQSVRSSHFHGSASKHLPNKQL